MTLAARLQCLGFLTLLAALPLHSQEIPDSVRVPRLAAVGRLYSAVRFFHPFLGYRGIDWDAAVAQALPAISVAETREDYRAAVDRMLEVLDDPATRVVDASAVAGIAAPQRDSLAAWWLADGVLLIRLLATDNADVVGLVRQLDGLDSLVRRSRAVILDLRAPEGWASGGMVDYLLNTSRLPGGILPLSVALPTERTRIYEGYPPDDPSLGATFYRSGWQVPSGTVIAGSHSNPVRPVTFLVNPWSELPTLALATRAAGPGRVIGEGPRTRALGATTRFIPLVEGLVVELRVSELISAEGTEVPILDTLVPAATERDDPALSLALRWSAAPHAAPAASRAALPVSVSPGTSAPEAVALPGPNERLVGLFRLWGAIEYFHAYPDLYQESWAVQLERFIPQIEQAGDSVEYALAIAELMTHTRDSHGFVQAPGLNAYYGEGRLPLTARMIEGRPIVTHLLADSLAPGVRPGDEIVRIEGEPMRQRLSRVSRFIPASNRDALQRDALSAALRGHGSTATLELRGADARIRTVRVARLEVPAERPREKPATGRSGPILRLFPGNIGYADLDRLSSDMVDSMFTMFSTAKGIIFDMRGYPNGTAWQIAPRLTDRSRVAAALFTERIARSPRGVLGNATDEALERSFVQYLPAGGGDPYRGWTVMLVDERTQSQAEHTGLFFEAANGTKFVGSRTAGTNGDVTNVALPGDILVWFTGLAVRHADGRPLQRVGLEPDIPARPTIRGIRAGRDEVLERALAYLRGLPPRRGKR